MSMADSLKHTDVLFSVSITDTDTLLVYYLLVWRQGRSGFCTSSAASAAACWRSSGHLAARSPSSESVAGTCPPTADCCLRHSLMERMMNRWRRMRGPAPSWRWHLSLSQAECYQLQTCCHVLVPGWSLMGSGCEGTWSFPWRGRSSGPWEYFLKPGWGESWSLRLYSMKSIKTISEWNAPLHVELKQLVVQSNHIR